MYCDAMKAFLRMLRQYVAPYSKYLGGSLMLNLLSVVFNVFSFSASNMDICFSFR